MNELKRKGLGLRALDKRVIAERFRKLRESLGLNRKQFAEHTRTSLSSISRIELGLTYPSFETLVLVCHYTGTSVIEVVEMPCSDDPAVEA